MKTLTQLSPMAAPLAVAVSLVLFSGKNSAVGAPGGGPVGGAHGAVAGTSAVGVSHAGAIGAGRGGISSAHAISGAHPGVSISNNSGTRGMTFRGAGAPSSLSLPYHNTLNTAGMARAQRSALSPAVSRPANAWSGLAVNPGTNGNAASARAGVRSSYRNNWTANGFTGQRLNAGAPGANLPTYNRGDHGDHNRNLHYRFPGRYYYYPYAYGPYYAPYINYFGGTYAGAYPYYNDIPAADTQFSTGATTVSPEYVEEAPANADHDQQPDASAQQSPAPAPQRQDQPNVNGGTIPNNGPDSLVEAVQEELVRRGYFGGKVDAMFNPETKEALRKFQADHHLATSGLINEATLHALQLD